MYVCLYINQHIYRYIYIHIIIINTSLSIHTYIYMYIHIHPWSVDLLMGHPSTGAPRETKHPLSTSDSIRLVLAMVIVTTMFLVIFTAAEDTTFAMGMGKSDIASALLRGLTVARSASARSFWRLTTLLPRRGTKWRQHQWGHCKFYVC